MSEVVSAVVLKNMPLKQKDPGAFTIPCVIGNASFKRALCDLGASISVMPKHVYDSLSLEPLNKTSIIIQLADCSCHDPNPGSMTGNAGAVGFYLAL